MVVASYMWDLTDPPADDPIQLATQYLFQAVGTCFLTWERNTYTHPADLYPVDSDQWVAPIGTVSDLDRCLQRWTGEVTPKTLQLLVISVSAGTSPLSPTQTQQAAETFSFNVTGLQP